jgi:GNAT superfamily N-acetyltransferase
MPFEPELSLKTGAGVVTFRPIRDDDQEFLLAVYSSTRVEELEPVQWPEAHKAAFLKMQFEAQHQYYREYYEGADFLVILLENEPVGRLYLKELDDEIRLIDIALLPERRSGGIGTVLINRLQEQAEAIDKALRIHVEKFNPALRLYERLGFKVVEDRGVYWFMEWRPNR